MQNVSVCACVCCLKISWEFTANISSTMLRLSEMIWVEPVSSVCVYVSVCMCVPKSVPKCERSCA